MATLELLNSFLGLGTLATQLVTVLLIILFFTREPVTQKVVGTYALVLGFIITAIGVVLSLIYSEYFGIVPCGLCWFQRIFLYPQVALFAIAWWVKDKTVVLYSICLSLFGAVISLYQHYLQMGGTSALPCPASGVSDCAKRFLFEFGYITFPLMAFSVFILLIVLMLFYYRQQKECNNGNNE